MTNPSNSVGTNAAYAGRTSANAFNDDLAPYSRGVLSGWGCTPSSGLTVALGGDGSTRDVAVAEDNAGNKTTINNISGAPVEVTLSAAPGANSRIDAIVAYVDNPPQGSATITDNYEACGLIPVSGTASASPTAPTDSQIRSAITADGASGTTAYYVVLATVTIPSGTTDITTDNIANGGFSTISSQNVDSTTLGYKPGDSLTMGGGATGSSNIDYIVVSGLITSSRAELVFSIVTPKPLTDINSVTLTNSKLYVRHIASGYIIQGANLLTAADSVNIGISAENTITISAVKTNGWADSGVANNTPIVVEGGFVFEFS